MEASQYLRLTARWWWLFVICAGLGGTVAYAASGLITPTYRATATLLVVQTQTPGVIQLNDLETSAQLANTFSRLITVRPVLEEAIERGGFDMTTGELRDALEIRNPRTTQLLEVSATSEDPVLARDIANVVSEVFIDSREAQLTSTAGVVNIVEPAVASSSPISPRRSTNAALGGALGLVLSSIFVVLFEYATTTSAPRGATQPR